MLTGNSLPVLFYETLVFCAITGFAVYDLFHKRVPDRALVLFCPAALAAPFVLNAGSLNWQMVSVAWLASLAGAAAGFGILLTAALVSKDGTGVGGGDIKLAGIMGFIYGMNRMAAILLTAAALAAIAVLLTRRNHRNENLAIPFVPFLAMGNLVIAAALKF
ncbi:MULTISPECIES: prepilin peptidase [Hungatella]|uniref:Potassium transporter TrkH n=1 Tax=Hungatella hathewayi TaxID=154046 RepID=A0A374P2E4_9FIRM|nr:MULTISPECIES: prepilin peptidase [Hungatella]MBC5705902.1 prepilin peptidase [Hungatella sp. L36]MBS5071748.1 prepilin peptidase [Hungatella hathewayi]MBS5242750.1 prepilin peptidase [Hungatella hathewayi]MBS6756598.1 prepilin peptidase [Hungatella hathewayi]MBT9794807.1 potassium transporter TrkH [Hungatella hathewayi]